MKNKILIMLITIFTILLSGCTQELSNLQQDTSYLDEGTGLLPSNIIILFDELYESPWKQKDSWGEYKYSPEYSITKNGAILTITSSDSSENIKMIINVARFDDSLSAIIAFEEKYDYYKSNKDWIRIDSKESLGDNSLKVSKPTGAYGKTVDYYIIFQRNNFLVMLNQKPKTFYSTVKFNELFYYADRMDKRIKLNKSMEDITKGVLDGEYDGILNPCKNWTIAYYKSKFEYAKFIDEMNGIKNTTIVIDNGTLSYCYYNITEYILNLDYSKPLGINFLEESNKTEIKLSLLKQCYDEIFIFESAKFNSGDISITNNELISTICKPHSLTDLNSRVQCKTHKESEINTKTLKDCLSYLQNGEEGIKDLIRDRKNHLDYYINIKNNTCMDKTYCLI